MSNTKYESKFEIDFSKKNYDFSKADETKAEEIFSSMDFQPVIDEVSKRVNFEVDVNCIMQMFHKAKKYDEAEKELGMSLDNVVQDIKETDKWDLIACLRANKILEKRLEENKHSYDILKARKQELENENERLKEIIDLQEEVIDKAGLNLACSEYMQYESDRKSEIDGYKKTINTLVDGIKALKKYVFIDLEPTAEDEAKIKAMFEIVEGKK